MMVALPPGDDLHIEMVRSGLVEVIKGIDADFETIYAAVSQETPAEQTVQAGAVLVLDEGPGQRCARGN